MSKYFPNNFRLLWYVLTYFISFAFTHTIKLISPVMIALPTLMFGLKVFYSSCRALRTITISICKSYRIKCNDVWFLLMSNMINKNKLKKNSVNVHVQCASIDQTLLREQSNFLFNKTKRNQMFSNANFTEKKYICLNEFPLYPLNYCFNVIT